MAKLKSRSRNPQESNSSILKYFLIALGITLILIIINSFFNISFLVENYIYSHGRNPEISKEILAIKNGIISYENDNGSIPPEILPGDHSISNTDVNLCKSLVPKYLSSIDDEATRDPHVTDCSGYHSKIRIFMDESKRQITLYNIKDYPFSSSRRYHPPRITFSY